MRVPPLQSMELRFVRLRSFLSPLFREAFGRRVGRQGDPGVARLLPHRNVRGGEIRVGEVADGNVDQPREACVLPIDG